ncbi:MAG: SET domain-containing protein-lysine N-methyltransferase, partial [Candidatus Riflebacteria bacterium]
DSRQKWSEVLAKLQSAEEADEFELEISAEIDSCETEIASPNASLREVYRSLTENGFAFDSFLYQPGSGFINSRVHRLPTRELATGYISDQMMVARHENGENYVAAREDLPAFTFLIDMSGKIVEKPSRYTLQIGENQHIDSDDADEFNLHNNKSAVHCRIDNFFDHSCAPNCRIEVYRDFVFLRLIKPVKAGESLSFNYLTTEWEMFSPFSCYCGAPSCFGNIRGFRFLSLDQKRSLRHLLSPFLLKRLAEEESSLK